MAKKFSGVKPGDRVLYYEAKGILPSVTPAVVVEADADSVTGHALLEMERSSIGERLFTYQAWAHHAPGTPGYYGFEGEEAETEVVEEAATDADQKPAENI